MNSAKTILRRVRTLLWTAFSIVVVLAAVVSGIGKLLMPYADRYQPRLESWLSSEFGQPVVLEQLTGEWVALGPRLSLKGMKLLPPGESAEPLAGTGEAEVVIESAALDIRPLSLLLPGPLYNFRVSGADFELTRDSGGGLRLSGFGVSRRDPDRERSALAELLRVGDVVLEDSSLVYRDLEHGIELGLDAIEGQLQMQDEDFSAEVRAVLRDERSGLVYGEIEAVTLLEFEDEGGLRAARWQATLRELMLAAFQGRLPSNPFLPLVGWFNAELWGEWSADDGFQVRGISDLKEARLVNEHQDLWLDRLNTRFQLGFAGRGRWELHFADLLYDDGDHSWTAPRVSMARHKEEGLGLWISADRLPLQAPLRLTRDVLSIYDTPWPRFLPRAAQGTVTGLDLLLDSNWKLRSARGELEGASLSEWDRWPDLDGLEGSVSLHRGAGRLRLSGERVRIDWPRLFREPIEVRIPSCSVDLRWGDGWQAGIEPCRMENADLAAHGTVRISSNVGKPAVDVNVLLERGDIGSLDPYWPEFLLQQKVKDWLRDGLEAGRIERGRVLIRGDMDDFPFRDGEGRFEATAAATGVQVDYQPGWPRLQSAELSARFIGASMDIQGTSGSLAGVPLKQAQAWIADFAQPKLVVSYGADSTVPAVLDFLQQTPIGAQIEADLERFEFAGQAAIGGALNIPMGSTPGELQVDGAVRIRNGRFSEPAMDITVEGISGRLQYDERGFRGAGLEASYRDHPARLALAADAEGATAFRAELKGKFGVMDVMPAFLVEDFSTLSVMEGACEWEVALEVERAEGDEPAVPRLRLASQLEGVSLGLPAPLDKPAGDRWPLVLSYPLSGSARVLELDLPERLALRFDLPDGAEAPRAASIGLGGRPQPLPDPGKIRLGGWSPELNLDGWLDIVIYEASRGRDTGSMELEAGDVSTGRLTFLDRHFADVDMSFSVEESGVRGEFASEDLDGVVRFNMGASGMNSLSAEFERLALGEPVETGLEMETDPSDLPALHLYARSMRYGRMELGETRIEAFPSATGFHFEMIDAQSDRLSVQASGDWIADEAGQRADFRINMTSESLGDLLESLDIASPVRGGQTLLTFDAWWPGSPASFALSRLNGSLEFRVIDGNISEANAGPGRLLGLLSVPALPKRLALDFRDVFDSGYAFDEASGTFRLEQGRARTDDVELRSSAATIAIRGETDLAQRQFDQLMTIRPGLGNTLPIIGALAGGPGGAAAGLALQGLLHESLAEASQVTYSIRGPWEEPQIEAVEVDRQSRPETEAEGVPPQQDGPQG